jgi:hypothetical protein
MHIDGMIPHSIQTFATRTVNLRRSALIPSQDLPFSLVNDPRLEMKLAEKALGFVEVAATQY